VRALHGTRSARLVVLLRNPAERLWACWRFYPHYALRYGDGVDGFQAWFEDQSTAFRKCAAEFTARDCALYFESLGPDYEDVFYHADQLIKGMYSVFMDDWMEAFPREAILVLRAEDYYADNKATLQTVRPGATSGRRDAAGEYRRPGRSQDAVGAVGGRKTRSWWVGKKEKGVCETPNGVYSRERLTSTRCCGVGKK
jgi:hypothetical protein